jgi:peptidoglycan glycosyltransferase
MKTKKILLPVMTGLLVIAAAAVFAHLSYNNAYKKLHLAQLHLYRSELEHARTLFSRLEGSIWVKRQARLGRIITDVLDGGKADTQSLPQPDSVYIDSFYLPVLLKRLFVSGRLDRCFQLAKIGRFYGIPGAGLYSSAVLLEKGETGKAFEQFSRLPRHLQEGFIGQRLNESFNMLRAGARAIVRDRSGEAVGTIGKDNVFTFSRPYYRRLIQPVIIKEVLGSNIENGVRLSIDLELSFLALEALGEDQGSIVLVEPDSGEILAAVSDRKTVKKIGNGSSPAFEQMLEPASISKLITTTAAFRNNLDPDKEIAGKACRGARRYNGKFLYCLSALDELQGFNEALAVSCNTSFADLGVKVGWEKMLDELRLFGFDSRVKNPFALGKIIIDNGDNRSLADLSIGLENTLTTPLHAASIAAVFANDGCRVRPALVHAIDGFTGLLPQEQRGNDGPGKSIRILDESWLPAIREAMQSVTRYGGTAGFVAPTGFQVHMKTGTGGNYRDGYHTNYIGYAPADSERDKIAFCVRVTGKRTSYRIRKAGYGVTRELLIRLKGHAGMLE